MSVVVKYTQESLFHSFLHWVIFYHSTLNINRPAHSLVPSTLTFSLPLPLYCTVHMERRCNLTAGRIRCLIDLLFINCFYWFKFIIHIDTVCHSLTSQLNQLPTLLPLYTTAQLPGDTVHTVLYIQTILRLDICKFSLCC